MKFGVSYNTGYYGVDPAALVAVARHAEDRGFESFYVPEHVALYPGAAVYGNPIPPSTPSEPARSRSCGPPPGRRAGTLTRWSTRAGERST
jgi:hypothetical protein